MNESNLYFSEQVAAASERVSNAFDSTKVYSVGEYCTYEGRLYKFVEVKKAGDWDTNTVIETTMANEIYILNTTGIGTGYDVTLSVPVSGWSGDSAPYAQTVQALGMTADKGVIYALMTEGATATASERENYRLITGTQQGPNSVTFYATAKPSIDMTIRCFCGAGSEEKDNIEVVSDAFNASKEYAAGNYCIYGDTLYKFNSAKSAGAWDASKVTSTNVGTELAAVKTDVSMLNANFSVQGVIILPNSNFITTELLTRLYGKLLTITGKIKTVNTIQSNDTALLELDLNAELHDTVLFYCVDVTSGTHYQCQLDTNTTTGKIYLHTAYASSDIPKDLELAINIVAYIN